MTEVELRPITEADLEAVVVMINRIHTHDGIPEVLSMEELVDDLSGDEADMATDSRLALVDGEPVGYGYTIYLPSAVRLERCYLDGGVVPEHRNRGVGRALIEWGKRRATEQLTSSGSDLPKYIRVDGRDFVEPAHRLYARTGFEPIRYFDELIRPLTDLPSPDRADVAEIEIVPWRDELSEETRDVKNAAFADHWGSTPTSKARWDMMMKAATTRLDLSWLALNTEGAVVGYCINDRFEADDDVTGRRDGWIGNVGTLDAYRGRGIASALMIRSLHGFAAEGLTHAKLGVDSDSPTGAPRLYRQLGFEPHSRSITHEIQL